MKNALDKCCGGYQNTRFVLNDGFVENLAVCEKMWKILVELGRP